MVGIKSLFLAIGICFCINIGLEPNLNMVKTTIPIELLAIAQVESSGGKNTNHPILSNGSHAFGVWGMKGDLIRDTIKNNPNTFKRFLGFLRLKDEDLFTAIRTNYGIEAKLAISHYKHLLRVFQGNKDMVFAAWYFGEGGSRKIARQISPDQLSYVIKVRMELHKLLKHKDNLVLVP